MRRVAVVAAGLLLSSSVAMADGLVGPHPEFTEDEIAAAKESEARERQRQRDEWECRRDANLLARSQNPGARGLLGAWVVKSDAKKLLKECLAAKGYRVD